MSLPIPPAIAGKAYVAGYGVGRLSTNYTFDVSALTPAQDRALRGHPRQVRFLWELYTGQPVLSFNVDRTNKLVAVSVLPRLMRKPPSEEDAARAFVTALEAAGRGWTASREARAVALGTE